MAQLAAGSSPAAPGRPAPAEPTPKTRIPRIHTAFSGPSWRWCAVQFVLAAMSALMLTVRTFSCRPSCCGTPWRS
jgi:hypothetical protein